MRRCPSPLVSMKVPCVRFSPTERPMAMGVSLSLRSWKTSAGMVLRAARPREHCSCQSRRRGFS